MYPTILHLAMAAGQTGLFNFGIATGLKESCFISYIYIYIILKFNY